MGLNMSGIKTGQILDPQETKGFVRRVLLGLIMLLLQTN
jgi:hypothetical protein